MSGASVSSDPRFRLEPFGLHQPRTAFKCLDAGLTTYFTGSGIASDVKTGQATAFVLMEAITGTVAGYFTLSNASIPRARIPRRFHGMYEELPVTLLGRLAIDARWRGYALGPMLLAKAFEKILAAAQQVASIGVVVDPVNERIAHWYQQMGFLALHTLPGAEEVASEPVPQLPGRLYLPMKGVKQLVEAASG